ncbi:MAG: hypothetical protein QM640_12955 [Niabella sp.]
MKLYIGKASSPEDIKQKFSDCYPFLKIELHPLGADADVLHKKEVSLKRFTGLCKEGFVAINNAVTVSQLEDKFAEFGIAARVLRKSGKVWVGTLLTDNWTLQEQNSAGEEITNQS